MMGRPKKEIAQDQFEKLCGLQCTKEEIWDWFDVTEKTLDRWCRETYGETFSGVFAKKRGKGKISLRRLQWRLAEKSAAMAIFLGKNYLGQSDHVAIEDKAALDKLDEILNGMHGNAVKLQQKAE